MSDTPEELSAELSEQQQRTAVAWRELRRAITRPNFRLRLYGEDVMDIAQLDALDAVAEHDACRMSELAAFLRVDASTATRVVDRLAEAGLVERSADPSDRRARQIAVTPAGASLLERIRTRARENLPEMLEGFSESELVHFAALLERLVESVDRFSCGQAVERR
jgi:DNA-binding MarR family transcriptional regulator